MIAVLKAFVGDERGATAIEYGLIAGLICLVIISGLTAFGNKVDGKWTTISDNVDGSM